MIREKLSHFAFFEKLVASEKSTCFLQSLSSSSIILFALDIMYCVSVGTNDGAGCVEDHFLKL